MPLVVSSLKEVKPNSPSSKSSLTKVFGLDVLPGFGRFTTVFRSNALKDGKTCFCLDANINITKYFSFFLRPLVSSSLDNGYPYLNCGFGIAIFPLCFKYVDIGGRVMYVLDTNNRYVSICLSTRFLSIVMFNIGCVFSYQTDIDPKSLSNAFSSDKAAFDQKVATIKNNNATFDTNYNTELSQLNNTLASFNQQKSDVIQMWTDKKTTLTRDLNNLTFILNLKEKIKEKEKERLRAIEAIHKKYPAQGAFETFLRFMGNNNATEDLRKSAVDDTNSIYDQASRTIEDSINDFDQDHRIRNLNTDELNRQLSEVQNNLVAETNTYDSQIADVQLKLSQLQSSYSQQVIPTYKHSVDFTSLKRNTYIVYSLMFSATFSLKSVVMKFLRS